MALTEERKMMNYSVWVKKLEEYGCYSESLVNAYGDKIQVGSYGMNETSGSAYEGSLVDVILNHLCKIGFNINEVGLGQNENGKEKHPFIHVSKESLMRVLLLQHISKVIIFAPESEAWRVKKGFLYGFNEENKTTLKVGEMSAYLCLKHGVNLSEDEFEAMTIIDKTEKEMSQFQSPLSVLVKLINSLANVELHRKYLYMNEKLV